MTVDGAFRRRLEQLFHARDDGVDVDADAAGRRAELAAVRAELARLREGPDGGAGHVPPMPDDVATQVSKLLAARIDDVVADARGAVESRLAVLEDALEQLGERIESLSRDGASTTTARLETLGQAVTRLADRLDAALQQAEDRAGASQTGPVGLSDELSSALAPPATTASLPGGATAPDGLVAVAREVLGLRADLDRAASGLRDLRGEVDEVSASVASVREHVGGTAAELLAQVRAEGEAQSAALGQVRGRLDAVADGVTAVRSSVQARRETVPVLGVAEGTDATTAAPSPRWTGRGLPPIPRAARRWLADQVAMPGAHDEGAAPAGAGPVPARRRAVRVAQAAPAAPAAGTPAAEVPAEAEIPPEAEVLPRPEVVPQAPTEAEVLPRPEVVPQVEAPTEGGLPAEAEGGGPDDEELVRATGQQAVDPELSPAPEGAVPPAGPGDGAAPVGPEVATRPRIRPRVPRRHRVLRHDAVPAVKLESEFGAERSVSDGAGPAEASAEPSEPGRAGARPVAAATGSSDGPGGPAAAEPLDDPEPARGVVRPAARRPGPLGGDESEVALELKRSEHLDRRVFRRGRPSSD